MPSHVLRIAVVAAALGPLSAAAEPLSLEQALVLAVDRSEAARAARAGVASAGQAAVASGQMPDPMLRTGIENMPVTGADRFNTSSDSQTMKRIGISQEWLSQEKRSARQAAAEAAVNRETVQARAAAADARLQTALAYLDAWYAGEALKLATLTEHHVHQELEGSLARLSASTGGSPEVLALTTARGVAEDETAEVRQQQSAARLALQRWVGVPGDELVPVAQWPVPSEQAFVDASPAVLALRSQIEAARQSAALAATERKPNVTWEVSYGQRSGYSDMVSLGVSIPLPVAPADRQDRETAAKLALVDKAEAELGEATREATAEYRVLASDAQRLHERIERYQAGVLAPAQQRTAAMMGAYRSNQATFASLFEALHAEVDLRRKQLNLQRELARTQARLAFKPLTSAAAP